MDHPIYHITDFEIVGPYTLRIRFACTVPQAHVMTTYNKQSTSSPSCTEKSIGPFKT
jgi:hypothetical protein